MKLHGKSFIFVQSGLFAPGGTAGFRVKPGMTNKVNFDFLREHQN